MSLPYFTDNTVVISPIYKSLFNIQIISQHITVDETKILMENIWKIKNNIIEINTSDSSVKQRQMKSFYILIPNSLTKLTF